ncbi:MAG: glycosyltransferase family 4 protein [Nanoarchaeota archaeon]
MKVLFISEYYPSSSKGQITGGVEARCFNIAKELARKNDVVVITSYKKGEQRKQVLDNVNVLRVGPNHKYSHKGSFISRLIFSFAAYKNAIKIKGLELVDGYSFITYLPAYFIGKKLGVSKVITYHETWIGEWIKNKGLFTGLFGEIWERTALRKKWDKIISVSEFTKKELIKRGVSENLIEVVPNGVSLSDYKTIKEKKYSEPGICCIGRLTPKKRVEDIIKAIKIVKKKIPEIKCRIMGTGDELARLKKLCESEKLNDSVEFLGFVEKNEDLIKTLKKSHVYCSASVLEGFGITVIEAMACKVPYVISDIPPFKEISDNGFGGFIFKQKDYKDLAKKIILLLTDKNTYNEKCFEEEKIVEKYDWEKISKKIQIIYENILR